jgi:hypothetical protein
VRSPPRRSGLPLREVHGCSNGHARVIEILDVEFAANDSLLQNLPNEFLGGLEHFSMVSGREFRKVARLAHDQLRDPGRSGLADAFPPNSKTRADHFRRAAFESFQFIIPHSKVSRDVLAHDCVQQLLLAWKVEEQCPFGDAGTRGHFFGTRGGKALLDEEIERGFEKFGRPRLIAPLALAT